MPVATDAQLELAQVGALLVNELVADSRGMVEKPMQIQFIKGVPGVVPHRLEDSPPDVKVRPGGKK